MLGIPGLSSGTLAPGNSASLSTAASSSTIAKPLSRRLLPFVCTANWRFFNPFSIHYFLGYSICSVMV